MEKLHKQILILFIAYIFALNVGTFVTTLNFKQLVNPFYVKNRTVSLYYLTKHIIFESGFAVRPVQKEKVAEVVARVAPAYGVDPVLAKLVIEEESHHNQFAISRAGAMGLMQLMPATFFEMGGTDPFDMEQNITAGVRYLSIQLRNFKDLRLALSAYNAGPAVVHRVRRTPYAETESYVTSIITQYNRVTGRSTGGSHISSMHHFLHTDSTSIVK